MLVRAIALAAILISSGMIDRASAAEPSGEAVAVIQSTAVEGAAGNRPLAVKGPVYSGDLVRTDRVGQAQIRFRDDTRLVVGPESELTIDSFVFAGQSSAREFTINAVRGAFRFITGSSEKQAYTIKTPNATIGVRGTKFDVTVEGAATSLALYEGGVRLCDTSGPQRRCTELSGQCRIIIAAPNADFRWVNNVYERTALMDTVFPFAFRQSALRSEFRVNSRRCEVRQIRKPQRRSDESGRPPRTRQDRDPKESIGN